MSPRIGLDLDTILIAASEIADTKGIDEITLALLSKKLNIRPPSLYNHIEGLGDLKRKLAIYGLKKLYEVLAQSAIGRSGDDAVRSLGEAYVTFADTHPGLYEATLHSSHAKGDIELQNAGDQIVELVIRVLQGYHLKDEEIIHAVRGLRSIFHGFTSLKQKGGFGLSIDIDESFHWLIDTFLAGIHAIPKSREE